MKDHFDTGYCAVFRFNNESYLISYGDSRHRLEGEFTSKLEALLGARKAQKDRDRDPNFILDLTDVSRPELEMLGFVR